VSISRSKYD